MFDKVSTDADFIPGEHGVLHFWNAIQAFDQLRQKNRGKKPWSFLDGPITANNPMGVHHAWGRTYKDAYQRFFAMMGHELRYQNGFDCQGLWVEVEVEKQLNLGTKNSISEYGIDKFVHECKRRVLTFAARQTEQSIRLGYWMDWDSPAQLRQLAEAMGTARKLSLKMPSGAVAEGTSEEITARLGNPNWGGSYFTFSTENNETIWTFLKKCFARNKIYRGNDVMPWSGRGGSAYSQMEVAEGRKLTVHKSVFVRFPLADRPNEYLLVWTTTPWTLTSNVAAAVNPQLEYVRLKAKKDDAVYYFAKENLEFARLSKEFKEGFGGDWDWPKGLPKLKTIAQIFKENGGYEVLGTLSGAELVGWKYSGPFDELPAQNAPGGLPKDDAQLDRTGVTCHRVVDGGRDAEGKPNVTAGEGTGIVHIAPGCGDVDHVLGKALGIVAIAPLGEDGRFLDGFGPFTGQEATDPRTAEFVFEQLREKGLLVYVEQYPHIYPHCWRTGDELVFRLVDEWFINMDWRKEIMDVVRQIRWLPDSINGQEREVEWLTNMRDWMISKKRFWGLALPIWVDEQTGDFEVIGSLAELKERAVEGWDEFVGHTPHRPWIDRVKIRNAATGNLMTRVPDVGNPWLDAGIVPFSTMSYNTDPATWKTWYPADLVTECFPGQFRNWFYSLLSLATMMDGSPPFRTLLGHRLVMDEDGQAMHKSDGTAIWFEEAAEQLGVDTLRWMYLAQNPAVDLRFGKRHPQEAVTLDTPEGPISQTQEGLPCCRVTSKPADEVRRQILIPLWNTYAFFVNYARLDQFDPRAAKVPVAERPEIDRWIIANLQELIEQGRAAMADYNAPAFLKEAARFVDDLSNWYIRLNRRRFWRSRETGDRDKLAAYQTLHEVLLTLSKLLAPIVPFVAERMYQNLAHGRTIARDGSLTRESGSGRAPDPQAPASVHLCDYPVPDAALRDAALSQRMALAQRVVNLGHGLREQAGQRVRQPLPELRFACTVASQRPEIERLAAVIADELNVKKIVGAEHLDDLVKYAYKPNLKTLGPRYGKLLGAIGQALQTVAGETLAPLRRGAEVTLNVSGTECLLRPEDVLISTEKSTAWVAGYDEGLQVALSTALTPELLEEGMARDFVRHVQQMRKVANLEIDARIVVTYAEPLAPAVAAMLQRWGDYIRNETLTDRIVPAPATDPDRAPVEVGDASVALAIATA